MYYITYNCISESALNLMNTIRMLWEQHGAWTRMAIISMVFDLPDGEVAVERLLRNPMDFANALRPFYGDIIANRFGELLTEHLVIAAEIVNKSKAGNTEEAAAAERRWYENADEIALLLGHINPYWSQESWRAMLHEHLRLVKEEAVDMLTGNYAEGIETYDEMELQALMMADTMSKGIVNQFFYRFYN